MDKVPTSDLEEVVASGPQFFARVTHVSFAFYPGKMNMPDPDAALAWLRVDADRRVIPLGNRTG